MLMHMYQKPDRGFQYGKLRQCNIPIFCSNSDLFLQVNTNVTVAVSRLGLVSRESNVSGVFNLEAPFSRMERWELYSGQESRKCSTVSEVPQSSQFGFSFAPILYR